MMMRRSYSGVDLETEKSQNSFPSSSTIGTNLSIIFPLSADVVQLNLMALYILSLEGGYPQ